MPELRHGDHCGKARTIRQNRRKLNLKAGSQVLLRVDDEGIQIETRDQVLSRIQQRLCAHIPADRLLSEELIHDRRLEAAREEQP